MPASISERVGDACRVAAKEYGENLLRDDNAARQFVKGSTKCRVVSFDAGRSSCTALLHATRHAATEPHSEWICFYADGKVLAVRQLPWQVRPSPCTLPVMIRTC